MRVSLIALLLICGPAQAAHWTRIAKFTDGSYIQIDLSSIRVTRSVRRAWFESHYAPHSKKGSGEDANKWIDYYLFRDAFDCAQETRLAEAIFLYYDDGTYSNIAPEKKGQPVPPDSNADAEMKFICAWKPNR